MKSQFKKAKIKNNSEEKLFELSHKIVLNETQTLWQSSQLFLLSDTFLAGFIGTNLTIDSLKSPATNIGIFFLSLAGIFISILWFISYKRISTYYKFRIAQARQREPDGWMLFDGDPKNLAEGSLIEIDREKYKLPPLSNLTIVSILVGIFILFYFIICTISFPWKIVIAPKNGGITRFEDYGHFKNWGCNKSKNWYKQHY